MEGLRGGVVLGRGMEIGTRIGIVAGTGKGEAGQQARARARAKDERVMSALALVEGEGPVASQVLLLPLPQHLPLLLLRPPIGV